MDAATIARETASRLRVQHPQARYELDWKAPEQLLVAAVLAGGSRDTAVNDVTKVLFARWPDTRARGGRRRAAHAGDRAARTRAAEGAVAHRDHFFNQRSAAQHRTARRAARRRRKTANVVLTQAFGIASGVIVDLHMARVAKRLGLTQADEPDQIERDLMQLLLRDTWVHFGAAGVLHGRYTCLAQEPRFSECVLSDLCPSAPSTGWPDAYQLTPVVADSIPNDWAEVLRAELASPCYAQLLDKVKNDRSNRSPP